jgi:fluoride exporter
MPVLNSIVAICVGASLGALLRWALGLRLNGLFPDLPPGTLVANLVGGYIIGVAMAWFATAPGISAEWRLFVITGFCGGLTTFSTFSAEVVTLLQQGRLALAAGTVAAHVVGSVAATFLGIGSYLWLART